MWILKQNKVLTISLALGIIMVSTLLIFLFLTRFQSTPQSNIPAPTPFIPPHKDKKITISGIQVNNFLLSPVQTNTAGDIEFIKDDRYSIVFLSSYNQFLITILQLPFDVVRTQAEIAFLQSLGVSPENACQLTVLINVPFSVSPELSDNKYRLSFCENKQ